MSEFAEIFGKANIKLDLTNPVLKDYFKAFEEETKGEVKLSDISGTYDMSKKRIFHKDIDVFIETQNNIFKHFPDIFANLLIVKMNLDNVCYIDNQESMDELVEDLFKIIDNKDLVDFIEKLVEETFTITVESGKPSKNEQLQFKDSYCKNVIKTAYLYRLVIPSLVHFMHINNIRQADYLFMSMVGRVFELFKFEDTDGEIVDMGIKLQKFVATSVTNTLYSDKVIWNYLRNKSITDKTLAIEIHRSVMCYILPKTRLNTSIVAFFHVVVTAQIDYQFTSNFKIDYLPIQTTKIESESSNPFSRMEQKLSRAGSELDRIMIHQAVKQFIDVYSYMIDSEDLDYFCNNVVINPLQTKLISLFIKCQLGSINIYQLDKVEYVSLMLIAEYWFRNNSFDIIADILIAKPISDFENQSKLLRKGSKLLTQIISSALFKRVYKEYAHMGEEVETSILTKFIGEILNTEFVSLDEEEPMVIDSKNAVIEILEFIEFI